MASNGGMQHEYDGPPLAMQEGGNPATGAGGNTTLINNDECEILNTTIEDAPVRASHLQEDDSHVMGAWKAQAAPFAGS